MTNTKKTICFLSILALFIGGAYGCIKFKEHIHKRETGVYFLERSKKLEEYGNRAAKLTELQQEIDELQAVIHDPASSESDVREAKSRIEEIVEILNDEYDAGIDIETIDLW